MFDTITKNNIAKATKKQETLLIVGTALIGSYLLFRKSYTKNTPITQFTDELIKQLTNTLIQELKNYLIQKIITTFAPET